MAIIFSKLLTKTDVSKRLSIPTKCLKYLPSFRGGHAVDFQAMDESDNVWTFRCSIRKKRHLKPVLTKGWIAFACNKNLKKGDKIMFWKEKSQSIYRIGAEREIKIFGVTFGYSRTAPQLHD